MREAHATAGSQPMPGIPLALSGASPLADRTGAATMAALRIRPNIRPAAVLMGSKSEEGCDPVGRLVGGGTAKELATSKKT